MSMLSNVFSTKGLPIPDVHINSKAFDELSIVKRMYDRFKTAQEDLNRVVTLPTVYPFQNNGVISSNSMTEGQSEFAQFMSAISNHGGLAKPNWFKVFITAPQQSGFEREASLFCESAQFPSGNIFTSTLTTYGPTIELPYARGYEPLQLTFLVDTDMKIKRFFDNWLNLIIDDEDGEGKGDNNVNFMEDYATTLEIYQLSPEKADIVYQIQLQNAYPKMVNTMDLNHSSQSTFHRLGVQFVYSKLIVTQVNTAAPMLDTNNASALMKLISGASSATTFSESDPFGANFDQFSAEADKLKSQMYGVFDKTAGSIQGEIERNVTSVFGE